MRLHFYQQLIDGNFEDDIIDTDTNIYDYESILKRRRKNRRLYLNTPRLVETYEDLPDYVPFVCFTPKYEPSYGGKN